jgi:ribonuclease P protein component
MRRGSDFTVAVRRGRRAGRKSLVVHCLQSTLPNSAATQPGSAPSEPLVGFVVPKSVGPSVVRNRVQRRLRHLMRDRVQALPAGCLIVIRAQPASATQADLSSDLDGALADALRGPARRSSP